MPSSAARSPEGAGPTQQLPPLLVICGPTATGKTALSLALAERIDGAEIIGADSRQVYRGMDIGTAKVSAADRARVPHHGLDLVDPDERFTAAEYVAHAREALAAIDKRGGIALLVGGTGLYVRALARGLPLDETGSDPTLRGELEEQLVGEGLHVLVARLRSRAPTVAATTDLSNPRRVVRALERVETVGDAPPPPPRGYPGPVGWIGLDAGVETHDRWIAERSRWQFDNGLLGEAAALRERFDPAAPAFSAVGYREAFAVLDGELSHDEAVELNARRNRQLARRQRTWFRAEPDVKWLDASADPLPAALAAAARLLGATTDGP
jgi:tRNA dimethylallyltransferase